MRFQDLVRVFERLEATTKRLEMFEILAELFRQTTPDEIAPIIYMSQGSLLPAFHGLELGMSEKLLTRALAQAAQRAPEDVLAHFKGTGDLGTTAEALLAGRKGKGLTVTQVYTELLRIARTSGEGSVEKKLCNLADLLALASPSEAKYIARFVLGRLRLGVGDATVLEALALEIIFEGEALAFDEGTGELLPFQTTIQRKRKHGVEDHAKEFPLKLFAFDLLYVDGEDWTPRPYRERRAELVARIAKDTVIEPAEMEETDDAARLRVIFESAIARGLEGIVAKRPDSPYAAGARNFNWIKLKRSYKGELSDTVDLCLVGYFRGGGKRARFGIGAVLAAAYDPASDSFKTVSRIGTGFSDEEWVQLRERLDEIAVAHKPARVDSKMEPDVWVQPTYVVTVAADEITRSPLHTCGADAEGIGYALRFPRVQGFLRADKRPEDANTGQDIIALYEQQRRVKLE